MIKEELFLDWKGRKKHDKRTSTTFIYYEIEIKESDCNVIEISFANRDNSTEVITINNVYEPLSFAEYDFLNERYLIYSEGIIWGFQYAINSYSKQSNKFYNAKVKILDIKSGIIVVNEMFSYLIINGLFKHLNYTPLFKVQRINDIYINPDDYNGEEFIVYFPEPPYPPTVGQFSKVWYKEHPEIIREIEEKQAFFYEKYCIEYKS